MSSSGAPEVRAGNVQTHTRRTIDRLFRVTKKRLCGHSISILDKEVGGLEDHGLAIQKVG